MRMMRALGIVILATTGLALQQGCSGSASATSKTIAFVRGDSQHTVDGTPQAVTEATVAAAKDLELPVDSHAADGLGGNVEMHQSDGTKISVSIRPQGTGQCAIGIRVGSFGDKELQERIFERIKNDLAGTAIPSSANVTLTPPTPTPPPPVHTQPQGVGTLNLTVPPPPPPPTPVMDKPADNPLSKPADKPADNGTVENPLSITPPPPPPPTGTQPRGATVDGPASQPVVPVVPLDVPPPPPAPNQ